MSEGLQKGRFIVFEGIDGCGKSTQARLLAARMRELEMPVHETREPTDGVVGRHLREILTGQKCADEKVIAALFAADRLDHILNEKDGLLAILQGGTHVISDRYYLSSYAYQSVHSPLEWIMAMNAQSAAMARPDCHIFIDVSPETAISRIAYRRASTELYETSEHLTATRMQFFEVLNNIRDTDTIAVINGERSEADIAEDVWRTVRTFVGHALPLRREDELVEEEALELYRNGN